MKEVVVLKNSVGSVLSILLLTAVAGVAVMAQGPGGNQADMRTIHELFDRHRQIRRSVTSIERGVETLTESDDPATRALIVEHAEAMRRRLAERRPIRMWDPLFAALFRHADKIRMEVTPTARGVKIVETSTDPYVVSLIQAHAEGVSEFVREGVSVMHKSHDLPGEKSEPADFVGKGDGVTTCPVTGQPVNREIKFGFDGRTVYFCCESCREAFKKSSEKFLRR